MRRSLFTVPCLTLFLFLAACGQRGNETVESPIGSESITPLPKLTGIELSRGTLEPPFDPKVESYQIKLGYLDRHIEITPITSDPNLKILVNDNFELDSGASLSLSIDPNLPTQLRLTTIAPTTATSFTATMVGLQQAAFAIALPPQPSQRAYFKASNTDPLDRFGSVSISGDTMVVGALSEASNATGVNGDETDNSANGAGAAYVFVNNGGVWSQQAYLKASNTQAEDNFGNCVSISGDTIVVGAIGEDSNATGINGNQASNTAMDSGAVYVFTRTGGVWSQQAYIKASNTDSGDLFGQVVAIENDTLVVSSLREDSNATGINGNQNDNSATDSGAAYVFTRTGGVWSQQAYLKASNTDGGDFFGVHLAMSDETVIVGADLEGSDATGVNGDQNNNNAPAAGAAYVFVRNTGSWSQQAYLKASNTESVDLFGFSVAISGDRAVVGALLEDSDATGVNGDQLNNLAMDSGAAYVFTRNGITWTQDAYLKASNTDPGDQFSSGLAIEDNALIITAGLEASAATGINGNQNDNSATASGAGYLFMRGLSNWRQHTYIKPSNTDISDKFGNGKNVALRDGNIAIGAYFEDSAATGVNGNDMDNSGIDSGAVYLFR